jgi:hypothetical protein
MEGKASSTALRLCDLLFETPMITIPEVQKRLGYKVYNSAKMAVPELQRKGTLVLSSSGYYEKSYKATRILRIISQAISRFKEMVFYNLVRC